MPTALHWFRRDLRLRDNPALHHACAHAETVLAVYVIDPRWFGHPDFMSPHQTAFLLHALAELSASLADRGIPLLLPTSADPVAALLDLVRKHRIDLLTYNRDYEPAQRSQDDRLHRQAQTLPLTIRSFKDAVIFHEHDLLTQSDTPYTIFTPYKNAWLKNLTPDHTTPLALPRRPQRPANPKLRTKVVSSFQFPVSRTQETSNVEERGAQPAIVEYANFLPQYFSIQNSAFSIPPTSPQKLLTRFLTHSLADYPTARNYPCHDLEKFPATSHLSAHLSAGTISPRQILHALENLSTFYVQRSTFQSQLIWRDFYKMILFHFPHTVAQPFQRKYRRIQWTNAPELFHAWSTATTGIPLIDAAMVQLLTTGFMHNRLRMLTAMFLTKHLDTHWTTGEHFFMQTLIDYDQANNVGGWQWSASTGTDAAPYFRLMNPIRQSKKFDPDAAFIKHYLPVLRRVPAKYIHTPWLMPPHIQTQARCPIDDPNGYPAPVIDLKSAGAAAINKFRRKRDGGL